MRVDAHAVLAAAEVLIREIAGHVVEHGTVECLAGRQSYVAQRLLQILRLDVLVARDLEALDGWTFQDDDDQCVAVAAKLHVTEEPCGVEGAHRLAHTPRRQAIADVDGKIVVDGALGHALEALHANVPDSEIRIAGRG